MIVVNDIKSAFTGGNPVKAIYTKGVKVWPVKIPLPEGYTQVKCVYWNNTSYHPLIYIPLSNSTLTSFKMVMDVNITTTTENYIIGWKNGGDSTKPVDVVNVIDNAVLRIGPWGSGGYTTTFTNDNCGRGIMTIDLDNRIIRWNGPVGEVKTQILKYTDSDIRFYFFEPNIPGAYFSKNKIYNVKIYSGDTVIMHLVPVVKDNGDAGFYDVKNNKFYGDDGIAYDTL